jgi:ketosteroid isomerase-like protein
MTLQPSYVESLFANLENGKSDAFFEHVADDVNWTVMGSHPLAGDYRTKVNFLTHLRQVEQDSQGGRGVARR